MYFPKTRITLQGSYCKGFGGAFGFSRKQPLLGLLPAKLALFSSIASFTTHFFSTMHFSRERKDVSPNVFCIPWHVCMFCVNGCSTHARPLAAEQGGAVTHGQTTAVEFASRLCLRD